MKSFIRTLASGLVLGGVLFGGMVMIGQESEAQHSFVPPTCREQLNSCFTSCNASHSGENVCAVHDESCLDSCLASYTTCLGPEICNPLLCDENEINKKEACAAACEGYNTDANGHLDVENYVICYDTCGYQHFNCPHEELCDDNDEVAYNTCYDSCSQLDPTSIGYETCAQTCIDNYPYCPHKYWNTSTTTTSSSSGGPYPPDPSSTGTSSTGGPYPTDTPVGTASTGTSSVVGGESTQYCKENYEQCNYVCDDEHIDAEGNYNDEHEPCTSRCADNYSSCLDPILPDDVPEICEPQLDACYDMCETEHVFIPEDCSVYESYDDPDSRIIENAEYIQCMDKNQYEKEQTVLNKGICIDACRSEFSQCVEPVRQYPKRPDLGPNACTPINLGLKPLDPGATARLNRTRDDFARVAQIPNTGRPNTGVLTDELLAQYGASSLFSDVSPYDYSYTPLATLMLQGVMKGYDDGSIRADEVVTRAELFKVILHSIEESVMHNCASYYGDVAPGSWFEPFINRAHELEILYPENGNANPARPLHFGEFLLIASRAFGIESTSSPDSMTQSQAMLNQHQLLPIWLENEDNLDRWITRRDLAEVAYRYIQMSDTNADQYSEELFMTIPDFGIYQLPIARSLLSQASSWLPATLNGGAYYQDTRPGNEGNFILFGHAAFEDAPLDPALNIFNDVAQSMQTGQRIELEVDGTLQVYEVTRREVVSGLDVDALADYGTSLGGDAVFFVCHSTPWERVILNLTRIQ